MNFKLALFACHGVRNITSSFCHPGRSRRRLIGSMLFAIALCLTACGGDSSTSVNDDESSSSAIQSSSSVTLSGASAKSNGSSSSTKKSSSSRMDSIGSSSLQNDKKSSSSTKTPSSSWSEAIGSSNSKPSSSSQKSDPGTSSGMTSSSKKAVASSSSRHSGPDPESSSSEYVPFDHSKPLAEDWRIGENRYKQFTDPRNGRSYYYITIYSEYKGYSVTVMAENLNIGEMVLGKNDQNDDTKIERYCYNNDTTKCDEFGGLYQWAEMMQLPSRCNTESCSNLIQPNHQGICPDGWRLFTYDDYCVVMGYKDEFGYGIKGLRSSYGFAGNNYSGWSLTGAGLRRAEGGFADLKLGAYWYYSEEYEKGKDLRAYAGFVSALDDYAPDRNASNKKTDGFSVRCVMVE